MKYFKIAFLVCVLSCFSFSAIHDYYISVTQIDYVEDKQTIQIMSRLFLDDLNTEFGMKFNKTFTFETEGRFEDMNKYIETYFKEKFIVKINGKNVKLIYKKKDYDSDIIKCYFEIKNVKKIKSIEITNKVLLDLIQEQQNIIKTNIFSKKNSFISTLKENTLLLNFN